ncbi:peptidyl-prolyl cis-trans isomerase CYP37, chloroplastic-like, partial [Papaver somniferum]|uniref:peptidyl-prolyl cis-trans isomerase CYP37, chloroplastic-like n=1 Tax=Papaver somniferum TaxID=3469 RepID=UPI000E6FA2B9
FSGKSFPATNDVPFVSYFSIFSQFGIKRLESAIAVLLIFIQISSPLPFNNLESDESFISPANAVLYSPDTKVPRTGELALRKAIPANPSMKAIQDSLEEISYLLRIPQRKPYGTMEGNVKKAIKIAKDEKESIFNSMPTDLKEKGSALYTSLLEGKGGLQSLLNSIKEKDPDRVSVGLASSLDTIAELELLQAPGLSFLLPGQYSKYPRLAGRGTVEFTVEKGDGSTFSQVAGAEPKNKPQFRSLQVVIDGYSAPLTAGNFAKLVLGGAYDGVKLNTVNQAILSANEEKSNGYSIPLELMPSGQFEPLYKSKLSIQDGQLPVLPLSVYGAIAMAHSDISEEDSSPFQFFFYLYDKRNAGLGGLSFDEGQFSVLGYTTVGRDVLPQIKTGDIIRSAKLVEGQDRLILPTEY